MDFQTFSSLILATMISLSYAVSVNHHPHLPFKKDHPRVILNLREHRQDYLDELSVLGNRNNKCHIL
jgi:hypothetical protein